MANLFPSKVSIVYEIGCQVKTPYGYGNVIQVISPDKLCVEFDEWKLAGGNHPKIFTTHSQILYGSSYDLGTCVLTRYGPGILIDYQRPTNIHVVRLWRPRGLGSATAYLNQADVLQKLAGFPGMKVVTSYGVGVLEGYSNGKYLVKLDYGAAYLNEAAILSCPEAKVFPTAECLADKALLKLKSLNWGDSFLSGPTAPIANTMTAFWERVRNGETQIDDALAERAKQINDHLTGLDLKEMHKSLQDRVESIVSEPGKIEMLLAEGKQRILQLIESADQRTELAESTKSALDDYLKTGKDQLDQAIEKVKLSSSESELKFIDTVQTLGSDVGGSLSVMKTLADADPVLKALLSQINDASQKAISKSKEAQKILESSKTGQVLKSGGENLSQRLENILNSSSSDFAVVKGFGKQLMSTIEKQGSSEKGKAIFNSVKSRIVRKITSMDSEKSISVTIEEKLMEMLRTWKSGMGDQANSLVSAQLSQLTVLLTMMGDGSMGVDDIVSSTQKKILTTLNDPRFKKTASDIARDRLTRVLVSLRESEETLTGKSVSGFHFFKEFNLTNFSDAQDSISQTMRDIADHTGVSGIIDNIDSPFLKDVTAPMGKIVTQIRSGNFDIDAAIQAAKESLDSELLAHSAMDLVARGEKVVSVLESLRSHDAVRDVLTKIQDLDIEKSISSRIMNFDADSVLDDAESALSDREARNRLLNSTKDQVLGFLLEHIPNMRIPDIQGVKDDVQFAVTRLDLSGFKLRKEDVTVSLGTSLNEEFVTCEARNISAAFNGVKWKYQQLYFPYLSGNGIADAAAQNASIRIGFKLVRVPRGTVAALAESAANSPDIGYSTGDALYESHPQIKEEVEKCRAELLSASSSSTKDFRAQLRGSSAKILKSAGTTAPSTPLTVGKVSEDDSSLWSSNEVTGWEPVLILSSRHISMESLSIKIEDSSLSWLYNLLASVFTGIIRDYVCASLKDMLGQQSAVLLGGVNKTAVTYWPFIHKILKVDIVSLREAAAVDVAALIGPPKPTGGPTEITPREYVMKFAESGPLGIQLDIFKTGLQEQQDGGDPSTVKSTGSKVVITGAVEGSQAERVFEASGIRAFMQHATIVAVNGKSFKGVNEDGVIALLRGARPLYITVRLSMNGWERLGIYRSVVAKEKTSAGPMATASGAVTTPAASSSSLPINKRKLRVVSVVFQSGPLGLKLKETKSCGGAVIVTGFSRSENDEPFQAERTGLLSSGMVMLSVNGKLVFGRPFDDVMEIIKAAARPMKMIFVPSPDKQVSFDAPPTDLVLGRIEGYVMVAAFKSEMGPAQQQGGIFPGIVILQVNKVTVTAETTLEEVEDMMRAPFQQTAASATATGGSGEETPAEAKTQSAPKVKLAVRDMDTFMHLIRIRDGQESLDDALDAEGPTAAAVEGQQGR